MFNLFKNKTELQFKTNINCAGCRARVKPFLDEQRNIKEWSVNTENMDKVLTVKGTDLNKSRIIEAVTLAGFKIK
jgi:copper chaperone CopZ